MDNFRYLILTPGRTGSSLLATILAKAGADFGMPPSAEWGKDESALEHPEASRLHRQLHLLYRDTHTDPPGPAHKIQRAASRFLAKRALVRLDRFWRQVDYVKVTPGTALLPATVSLGYQPRIILSIRPFSECATAMGRIHAHRHLYEYIRDAYRTAIENALLFMPTHGGCVIDFDDLLHADAWAQPLSEVTGFSADSLLKCRGEQLSNSMHTRSEPLVHDPEMDRLYERAKSFTNQAFL